MPASGLLGGRYRLEEPPIGEGGMGVVYRAVDTGVGNRKVAVKTISGPVDPASVEQFRKEWDVLADLCHANIVNVYDVGEFAGRDGKKPYFVMPLLRGSDLGKLLELSESRMDPERLVEIVAQVCKGLQSAHNRGIVHRDLKPSNIFLLEDDTVILIDFGLVHLLSNNSAIGIKGTLPYMAPEQLDGKATPQSDIFSLAVVCYEALTGRRPFTGETPPQLMDSIRSHIPPPISDLNPSVPFPLAQVIHRALAKQAYDRVSTPKEFARSLRCALDGEPIPLFDQRKIEPRLQRIRQSLGQGELQYANELLRDLEVEGHIHPEISILRIQVEEASRSRLIQQLLDSARLRLEEGNYPLAEQKVQSTLEIDPTNIDALALKRQITDKRCTAGVETWYQIACQHRDRQLFAKAREAIGEILKLNPNHVPAVELLADLKRREQEYRRLQEEMQGLYQSAKQAYGSGEFSTALSKLERILELSKRISSYGQMNGEYERLYNQVRLERDQLQASYAEARAAFESRDVRRAQNICREVIERRPRDALFKALLIEVDTLERQIRSASVAALHSQIEAEPDLERKFELARKAVKLFEDEPTFVDALRLIKEKRDLVNTIAIRAREYESQSQFVEARNQWQVLNDIYPQYPGLSYEVNRLEQKLQETWRERTRSEVLQGAAGAGSEGEGASPSPLLPNITQSSSWYHHGRDRDRSPDVLGTESPVSSGEISFGGDVIPEARSETRVAESLTSAYRHVGHSAALGSHDVRNRGLLYTQTSDVRPDSEVAGSPGSRTPYLPPQEFPEREGMHFLWRKSTLLGVLAFVVALLVVFGSLIRLQRVTQSSSKFPPRVTERRGSAAGPGSGETPSGEPNGNTKTGRNEPSPLPASPPQKLTEIRLRSEPEHAQVRADHKVGSQCETPCSLRLTSGDHVLVFTAPNREPVNRVITVPSLDEVAVTMPEATSTIKLVSNPSGLAVSVDGKPIGETPIALRLTVGPHQLAVVRDGVTQNETIDVGNEEDGLKIITIGSSGPAVPPAGT
jgi:serine/threonine protein kinase/phage shock protein A